jgi:hypothetical protein
VTGEVGQNRRRATMNSNRKAASLLEDVKIDVKIKLSALWIAVTFLYVYADIISFFRKEMIEEILTGEVAGIQINQIFLFGAGILMAIPAVMIFLSLILKAKANRWVNIILSIIYICIIILLQFMPGKGEVWAYYAFYNILELGLHLLIVLYAWKWPEQEA